MLLPGLCTHTHTPAAALPAHKEPKQATAARRAESRRQPLEPDLPRALPKALPYCLPASSWHNPTASCLCPELARPCHILSAPALLKSCTSCPAPSISA